MTAFNLGREQSIHEMIWLNIDLTLMSNLPGWSEQNEFDWTSWWLPRHCHCSGKALWKGWPSHPPLRLISKASTLRIFCEGLPPHQEDQPSSNFRGKTLSRLAIEDIWVALSTGWGKAWGLLGELPARHLGYWWVDPSRGSDGIQSTGSKSTTHG